MFPCDCTISVQLNEMWEFHEASRSDLMYNIYIWYTALDILCFWSFLPVALGENKHLVLKISDERNLQGSFECLTFEKQMFCL